VFAFRSFGSYTKCNVEVTESVTSLYIEYRHRLQQRLSLYSMFICYDDYRRDISNVSVWRHKLIESVQRIGALLSLQQC